MGFGVTVWAILILTLLATVIEAYDEKLAALLVMVTLFALFMGHAQQIVSILQAMVPKGT